MQYLSNFFVAAGNDVRITSTHILIYVALWESFHQHHFRSPFFISRRRIMKMTKILSTATYHKYIRELNEFRYICYEPSYHPSLGSKIRLLPLS